MTYRGPIEREEHIIRALLQEGWVPRKVEDLNAPLRALANAGERLRKRWENECSYEWANTDAYQLGTSQAETRVRRLAREAGLTLYLQTDPRGAPIYVRAAPHPIADNRYSTEAHSLYFNR